MPALRDIAVLVTQSSIPQQTTGRTGTGCIKKKEELCHKVIIHLRKKISQQQKLMVEGKLVAVKNNPPRRGGPKR